MDSNMKSSCYLMFSTSAIIVSLLLQEVDGHCENGYAEFNTSCYLYVDAIHRDWFQSRDHCKGLGHHLAEASSPEEINFLKKEATVRSRGTTCNKYWIGGTDMAQEDIWIWNENSEQVTRTDWGYGQPDNLGNQDCLTLWNYIAFRWDDEICGIRHCFICEVGYLSTFETTSATKTQFTDEETIPESRTAETSKIETLPGNLSESKSHIPIPHSTNETCRCFCHVNESEDDIKSSILRLKTSLTVNKTQTSRYKRNLISAQDHRVSSTAMGYVGVLVLISVVALIVALDVAKIMNNIISERKLKSKLNFT